MFGTSFSTDGNGFQNYYRDLANRVKSQEVDLLIVVGMFLTGFDAPSLNTLFVDKNLRYHGLLQAYSRTNRIFDATKTFGNIVAFRDLEQATIDAVTLFGESNTKNVVLEKSFREYMEGFSDITSGAASRGFKTILAELEQRFPDPSEILKEADKKDFAKLFGEFLKAENVLQNFDEYVALKALKGVNQSVREEVEAFKAQHHLEDDQVEELTSVSLPADRKIQDYKSTYNDIRDWLRREKAAGESDASTLDWDDVVFEVDLLKSQEINLDYILELIFAKNRNTKDKSDLIEEARRVIRASVSNRAKESLIVDFINRTNLDDIDGKAGMIEAFFAFAQEEQRREFEKLVEEENLNLEAAKRYITNSIKREFATENGNELNDVLPKMSPLNPAYLTKKSSVFLRMSDFVTKFMGVGGQI
jgi:type I restriction enzyme R subunit